MSYAVDAQIKAICDKATGQPLPGQESEYERLKQEVFAEFADTKIGQELANYEGAEKFANAFGVYFSRHEWPGLVTVGRLCDFFKGVDFSKQPQLKLRQETAPVESMGADGKPLTAIDIEARRDMDSPNVTQLQIKEKRSANPEYARACDRYKIEQLGLRPESAKPTVSVSDELRDFAVVYNNVAGSPKMIGGKYVVGNRYYDREQMDTMLSKASAAGLIR